MKILLVLLLLLTSCGSPASEIPKESSLETSQTTETSSQTSSQEESATVNVTVNTFGGADFVATSSPLGIYTLQGGVLSFTDVQTKQVVMLANLNIVDDKPSDKAVDMLSSEFKRYADYPTNKYIQYSDDALYYTATYLSVDGVTRQTLKRIQPDGTGAEELLTLNEDVDTGNMKLVGNTLYFTDMQYHTIYAQALGDKEPKQLPLENGENFIAFSLHDEKLLVTTFDPQNKRLNNYLLDQDAFTLNAMNDLHGELLGGDDKAFLYGGVIDGEPRVALMDYDGKTLWTVDTELRADALDDEHVYLSNMTGDQKYYVYSRDGNQQLELEIPAEFPGPKTVYKDGVGYLPISAVHGDHLFILSHTGEEMHCYLVEVSNNTWTRVNIGN